MTMPALAVPGPALPGAQPVEARQPRAREDLLAPSIWSDRARLLARPDVVAVELMLLVAAAVLMRQPLTELLGTAAEAPPVAPAQPAEPVSPLALVPVAPPTAARHEPRDPFAPLVNPAQPADGAPPVDPTAAPVAVQPVQPAVTEVPAVPPAPAPSPVSTTPATGSGGTITIKPGDTLGSIAKTHGISWTVLYQANRDVVGGNPHIVRPGTVLTIP